MFHMHAAVLDHLGVLPTGLGSNHPDRPHTPGHQPAVDIVEFIR